MWVLLIIGVAMIAGGVGLYFSRQASLNKAMDIKYYETSKISEVVSIYDDIKGEIGGGNYNGTIVELKGTGSTNNPLTAEFSKKPALYYEATVVREYEVTEQEKDSDGNYRTVTKRKSETVSSNKLGTPFYLDDGSGKQILIDIEGADLDLINSFDRFEQNAPAGFSLSSLLSSGSKTLGYRYKEKMLPVGAKLYILGEASDRRGELAVIKPQEKGKKFIVSTKSEEEILKSTEGAAMWKMVGAIALAVIGVGMVIGSFFA